MDYASVSITTQQFWSAGTGTSLDSISVALISGGIFKFIRSLEKKFKEFPFYPTTNLKASYHN